MKGCGEMGWLEKGQVKIGLCFKACLQANEKDQMEGQTLGCKREKGQF